MFGCTDDMFYLCDQIKKWIIFYKKSNQQSALFINFSIHYIYFFIFSRFLYPGIIALIVSSISYPLGTGQFIAGELSTHEQVVQLFSNFTWTKNDLTVEQATIVSNWTTFFTDVFVNLTAYTLFTVRFAFFVFLFKITIYSLI